ncbi:hypothetical protein J7643_11905 [bacterium]|nr:hypothetical protein [bacterium]
MRHWTLGLPLAIVVAFQAPAARAEVRVTFGLSASFGAAESGPRWTLATMPVGDDKLKHFVAGLAIAWALSSAGYDPGLALMGAGAAGALKEARDAGWLPGLGRGDVELADFAWTFAGGLSYLTLQRMLTQPERPFSLHNN